MQKKRQKNGDSPAAWSGITVLTDELKEHKKQETCGWFPRIPRSLMIGEKNSRIFFDILSFIEQRVTELVMLNFQYMGGTIFKKVVKWWLSDVIYNHEKGTCYISTDKEYSHDTPSLCKCDFNGWRK